VNPISLAGIARIVEPSENDARENQEGAAHADVPRSGLPPQPGHCSCGFISAPSGPLIHYVAVAVPIAMSPAPRAVYDLLKRAER
jgi:hypothetical protein